MLVPILPLAIRGALSRSMLAAGILTLGVLLVVRQPPASLDIAIGVCYALGALVRTVLCVGSALLSESSRQRGDFLLFAALPCSAVAAVAYILTMKP